MSAVITLVPKGANREAELASAFAVADIYPTDSGQPTGRRVLLNAVLPVGGRTAEEEVLPGAGNYRVRVRLPNGETVVQEVQVPDDDRDWTLVVQGVATRRQRKARPSAGTVAFAPAVDFLGREVRPFGVKGDGNTVAGQWGRQLLPAPVSNWVTHLSGAASPLQVSSDDAFVLHRLRAETPFDQLGTILSPYISIDEAARSSFGRAVALQPTKVRSPRSGPANSEWKVAERGKNRSSLTSRYYGVLVDNTYSSGAVIQNVASIPDRWIGMDGSTDDVFQAAIVPSPDFPDLRRIELTVSDPSASSLMSFLQTGDLDAALAVAKPAMGFVEQGVENAYAAVAAAYALVFSPSGSGAEGWERWVLELSDQREDIPDGKILEATLLLQRSVPQMILSNRRFPPPNAQERINHAWDCVLEALRRGPPVFRLGLGLLESNIRIIRDSESQSVDKRAASTAARVTAWFRARVDPYQPLCVFDVA